MLWGSRTMLMPSSSPPPRPIPARVFGLRASTLACNPPTPNGVSTLYCKNVTPPGAGIAH